MYAHAELTPANRSPGRNSTRELLRQVTILQEYIQKTPAALKAMCCAGGAAIVLNGILGVLDVFEMFEHTVYYVINSYQVFFGVVTILTELDEDWCGQQVHNMLHQYQKWMHEWALGLTKLWGRGLFYAFQGMFAITSSKSLISLGVFIGLYMVIMGILCIHQHFVEQRAHAVPGYGEEPLLYNLPPGASPGSRARAYPREEYIRVNY